PRRGDRDQHPRRAAALVLERVWRADRHVGEPAGAQQDALAIDRKRDLAVKDVEPLLLTAVHVRGRTAARRHDRLPQGVLAVRVLAGREEAVHVADDRDGAAVAEGPQGWRVVDG